MTTLKLSAADKTMIAKLVNMRSGASKGRQFIPVAIIFPNAIAIQNNPEERIYVNQFEHDLTIETNFEINGAILQFRDDTKLINRYLNHVLTKEEDEKENIIVLTPTYIAAFSKNEDGDRVLKYIHYMKYPNAKRNPIFGHYRTVLSTNRVGEEVVLCD